MTLNALHADALRPPPSPSPIMLSEEEEDEDDEEVNMCCSSSEGDNGDDKRTCSPLSPRTLICRIVLIALIALLLSIFYLIMTSERNVELSELSPSTRSSPFNKSKCYLAEVIIDSLCRAVAKHEHDGDICERLCVGANYSIADFYEGGSKKVIKLAEQGKDVILKMDHAFPNEYVDYVDSRVPDEEFTDKALEIVNDQLHLDWPIRYKHHLMRKLWPSYRKNQALTNAERRSIWALLQQEEFINLKILPLSRVTPKILGTCGHIYQPEYLIPFKMKAYYMNLKAKILVHLEGTLKLFEEFLNDPLNWCDVKFENLGLSADYPKRFVVLDSDMLYTKTKLQHMLTSKTCKTDTDCGYFDCESECNRNTGFCTDRTNDNIDVFCKKLISKLFGSFYSKTNKYLAACHESPENATKRLSGLSQINST